jgi:hypothetical protein
MASTASNDTAVVLGSNTDTKKPATIARVLPLVAVRIHRRSFAPNARSEPTRKLRMPRSINAIPARKLKQLSKSRCLLRRPGQTR